MLHMVNLLTERTCRAVIFLHEVPRVCAASCPGNMKNLGVGVEYFLCTQQALHPLFGLIKGLQLYLMILVMCSNQGAPEG